MSKRSREDGDNPDAGPTANAHPRKRRVFDCAEDPTSAKNLSHDDYTVGWLCALPLEMAAALAMLDEIHTSLEQRLNDTNTYALGEIGKHNIVIACLPSGMYGTTSATIVANQMFSTFKSIRVWLMVGIGGGVPGGKSDVRLGDIVVSERVIQHDFGKIMAEGHLHCTGKFNKPPQLILTAVSKLRASHKIMESRIPDFLSEMLSKRPRMRAEFTHPGQENDILFEAGYDHPETESTCENCKKEKLVIRTLRADNKPVVHYGNIASGNQVIKHGRTRDRLGGELGIICFEMEAAGLMENFSCLVIRGICDYADSHKNKRWQDYSAATAAAYAKEFLYTLPETPAANPQTIVVDATTSNASLERRQLLMDALRFNQIEARQATIKTAHAKTCKWLLKKPEYCDWLDPDHIPEHHGFLWIKGKPGTGKSTIMKFALKHADKTMKDCLIISFFFNARGESLEKSTEGMYRSLLFQLLQKATEIQSVLDCIGSLSDSGDYHSWDIEVLQDSLRAVLEKFGQRRLVCFIDALDECEEDQVRDMVVFFESLGQLAVSNGLKLHVCFSSRHYPHITIERGLEIVLEGQEGHSQDIATYVSSELKARKSKQVEGIITEILEKASGIFLWVVLVVQILNKEYDRGRLHALRKRLNEIPTQLNELFKDILKRDTDNMEELLLCIQWILYAKRPLKLVELYFALLSGEFPEDLTPWDPEEIMEDDMKRRLLSSSKGLAETTKSTDQIVQFIHESVRDFLLKDNGLNELWSELGVISLNRHERLKQCCYNYMKMGIEKCPPKTPLEKIPTNTEASEYRKSMANKYPFLEYAVINVLYHAELAESEGFSQRSFIDEFPRENWIALDNHIEKHYSRRHSHGAAFLYIFAEKNLPNLIRAQLKKYPITDIEGERYHLPIFAALAGCNENAAVALMRIDKESQSNSELPRSLYTQCHQELNELLAKDYKFKPLKGQTLFSYAAEHGKWAICKLLLSTENFNLNARRGGLTPQLYAIGSGQLEILKMLIEKGAKIGFELDSHHSQSPLSLAAKCGHEAVVKLLLENGVDLESKSNGRTPLSLAAKCGHGAVVKLLLENGADLESKTYNGQTPLSLAAESGHEAVVKLLLENGVDLESKSNGRTPLSWAAERGHEAVVKLLLENGADLESKCSSFGQTPLAWAAERGHEAVVKLLLENGADLESKSNSGRTPLSLAAKCGHGAVVKLLLENGADLESKCSSFGRTPLLYAAGGGHEAVVKLLLENGADLGSKCSSFGRTPLLYAVGGGHEVVVKLLLENGADLELKSNSGRTPLSYAAGGGHEVVVKLLLENGADLESKSNIGRTPLSYAAEDGREAAVKLLLENGADLESKCDYFDRTPLSYAAGGGHEVVVKLLLEKASR